MVSCAPVFDSNQLEANPVNRVWTLGVLIANTSSTKSNAKMEMVQLTTLMTLRTGVLGLLTWLQKYRRCDKNQAYVWVVQPHKRHLVA